MTVLHSALETAATEYAANRAAMLRKLAALDAEHAKAVAGGGEKYLERHRERGKLTARERIELLLDPDTPFLELSPLAAWGSDYAVGASLVTGIGVVERRRMPRHGQRPDRARRRQQPLDAEEGAARQRDRPHQPAAGDQPRRVRRRRPARPEGRSSSPAARCSAT